MGSALAPLALLQPIAVAVHFKDMDVVRQLVEQRSGESLGLDAFMMPLPRIGWYVGRVL